jgi:hypothetical protein
MQNDVLTPDNGLELSAGDCWFKQGELLAVPLLVWDTTGLVTGDILDRGKADWVLGLHGLSCACLEDS